METSSKPTIALLTDFGLQDAYVGVMKAVIRRVCAEAEFIDVTHAIQPQNVRQAALMLASVYDYFPGGTIFLIVVDPGVGSTRRPVAVQTAQYTFIAPDNGVLSYALDGIASDNIVELSNPAYQLQPASHTFHGRDIFAPAAAHLAAGVAIHDLGPALDELKRFPSPDLTVGEGAIVGEVIHIDHFGNVVTSIGELHWTGSGSLKLTPRFGGTTHSYDINAEDATITLNGHTVYALKTTYSEVNRGELVALVGSSGFLEVAVSQGNGAERLGISIGDRVEVKI